MAKKINIGWWYPIIKDERDFELLPDVWRRNTNFRAFPMHRSVMLENIEAIIEQQGKKDGSPLALVTVRATPSFMRKLTEKRFLEYSVKSIQETAAAMGRMPSFDATRIYDVDDIDSLSELEAPEGFTMDPDKIDEFSADPALLNANVNKVIAILYTIISGAVDGGMDPDRAKEINKEILKNLSNNWMDEHEADKIMESIKYVCDYRTGE